MAIKKGDKPENQGLKPMLRQNFGKDAEGRSYARQVLSGTIAGYTANAPRDFRNGSVVLRTVFTTFGAAITAGAVGLVSVIGNINYWSDYDGTVVNDASFYADQLENLDDPSGYITVNLGSDGAFMLNKNDDGSYELYEGHRENQQDWMFTRIEDGQRAAYISHNVAHELQSTMLFSDLSQNNDQDDFQGFLKFAGISEPIVNEEDGSIYRAIDDASLEQLAGTWTYSDLSQEWDTASTYMRLGYMSDAPEALTIENPIKNPRDDTFLEAWLISLGMLGGVSMATSAVASSVRSRRRFNEEEKQKNMPRYNR